MIMKNIRKKDGLRLAITFWAKHNEKLMAVFFLILIAFSILFPNVYFYSVAINCLIFTVLSLSLNLMTGYLGITSLGHAAFFGIGAYTTAILQTRAGVSQWIALLAAIVASAIAGIIVSLTTLRVSGRFVAIVTLGFSEIMRMIELNWMQLTRGPQGIPGIPGFTFFGKKIHSMKIELYIILAITVIIYVFYTMLLTSRHGLAIQAIKNDEIAATSMGIEVNHYRMIVFGISAATAGMAGFFYAKYMGFIDPNAFNFDTSISILSMTIFGGMGSLTGSLVGAFSMCILPEMLRFLVDYRQIIYGAILVLMMIFRPNGLLGGINFHQIRLLESQRIENISKREE